MRSTPANSGWWDRSLGYEIYVRSFQDSDGDGVGDLPGIISRLDYLAGLGVDIVWLTPFFPSPQADFGYDVSDHCAVDAQFGALPDFDRLVARAHDLGLRVLVDLVPNHTSDAHRWFVAALDGQPDFRDYYHWRDPAPDGGPPNNWVSHFGGPAWTFDARSGQYYLHLFLPEQPDLNWENPAVQDQFEQILRFWLERGVDGFRVDVAQGLAKDMAMPNNPQLRPVDAKMSPRQAFAAFEHRHDLDQPESKAIYRRWRAIADEYEALLLGEVYLRDGDPEKVARYVIGGDGLHRACYFAPMHFGWDPAAIRGTFSAALEAGGGSMSWALSSHDDARAPTRFGGGDIGRLRALSMATFMTHLPGLPFIYQGDELGLENVVVARESRRDPVGLRSANDADSRDGVRTPMPWGPGPAMGFSRSPQTWLPMGDRTEGDTAAAQAERAGSWLERMTALISARKWILDAAGDASVEWLDPIDAALVAYRRGAVLCALNTSDSPTGLELPPGTWTVAYASANDQLDTDATGVVIAGNGAIVAVRASAGAE